MLIGVQHDDGKSEKEDGVWSSELLHLVGVTGTVAVGKQLQ